MRPTAGMRALAFLLALALPACDHAAIARPEATHTTAPTPAASATPPAAPATARRSTQTAPSSSATAPAPVNRKAYAWLDDAAAHAPAPVDTLQARFPAPRGFQRVPLAAGSFGAWLSTLPLAAPGTPVVSYAGKQLHPADDPRIAAVVAIDIGKADLQQCADAVIRMNAEWKWSQGRRDMSYRAASGTALPFSRWARGERIVPSGQNIRWQPATRPGASHSSFRHYLDAVFAWANTVSVARQAKAVKPVDLAAGDFFIMGGNPGHAVLVLDIARDARGQACGAARPELHAGTELPGAAPRPGQGLVFDEGGHAGADAFLGTVSLVDAGASRRLEDFPPSMPNRLDDEARVFQSWYMGLRLASVATPPRKTTATPEFALGPRTRSRLWPALLGTLAGSALVVVRGGAPWMAATALAFGALVALVAVVGGLTRRSLRVRESMLVLEHTTFGVRRVVG